MSQRFASQSNEDASPAARLDHYLKANACIPYEENLKDREHPHITCSIFGVPKTNELFVRITNGTLSFVEVTPSPVAFPVMADRVFGIDVADAHAAFALAEKLWERHRDALLGGGSK
jgi:hypothetical protein